MASEIFKASRWTRGNFLFPAVVEVTELAVIRRKRSWFRKDEISIGISKIASVHIKSGLIWSDILIESSGGTDPLKCHGHRKADALRIRDLIQNLQGSWVDLNQNQERIKLS
jgi:hypothetical protein